MHILRTKNGFSLIEVVIALGVLAIGILSMFSMQLHSIKGNTNANRMTYKVAKGADSIEQIYNYNFKDDLLALNNTEIDYATKSTKPFFQKDNLNKVSFEVVNDSPLEHMATINVTITNKTDGKQLSLSFLRADPNEF